MPTLLSSNIIAAVVLTLALALDSPALAQDTSGPASLSKNSFIWNQEEIALGFLHYDEVFTGRKVPRGDKIHELPEGLPIDAFKEGELHGSGFGQFVLEDGCINGESIVPDDWFQALGIHGQMIHIDPARRLVVVINSAWPEADSNMRHAAVNSFLQTIAEELDEEGTESN